MTILEKASWFVALVMNSANAIAVAWFLLDFGTSRPMTDMLATASSPVICGPTAVASAIAGAFSLMIFRKFGPLGNRATRPAW